RAAGTGEILQFAERRAEGALQFAAVDLSAGGVKVACTGALSSYSPRRFPTAVILPGMRVNALMIRRSILFVEVVDTRGRARAREVGAPASPACEGGAASTATMRQGDPKAGEVGKVLLASRGGLDTSIILKWLQTTYRGEVVTFTADLGQGEEIKPAREKALLLGIKPQNIFIEDLREEFVRD